MKSLRRKDHRRSNPMMIECHRIAEKHEELLEFNKIYKEAWSKWVAQGIGNLRARAWHAERFTVARVL